VWHSLTSDGMAIQVNATATEISPSKIGLSLELPGAECQKKGQDTVTPLMLLFC